MPVEAYDVKLGNGHAFRIKLENGAVASVRDEVKDMRLALKSARGAGMCVKSLPIGDGHKPLKDVPVRDLIAYAARNVIEGGRLLTEDWLLRKHFVNNLEVVFKDKDSQHVSPGNLKVVMAQTALDVPQPALPRVCFARVGHTICGEQATTADGHTCSFHEQHEATAAKAHCFAQLCIFRDWLYRKHNAAAAAARSAAAADGSEVILFGEPCRGCQDPTLCKPCLSRKLAEVDEDIQQALGGTARAKFDWATAPMCGLFDPRIKVKAPSHRPHSGCCLAFAGKGGSRFCLRPVWQHDGQERLLCMKHIIAHAADSKFSEVEQAIIHHLTDYALFLKNRKPRDEGSKNPFRDSDKFNKLMGRPF